MRFEIQCHKTFCKNRSKQGCWVKLYVNENIPCRVLDTGSSFNDLGTMFLEFSLRNKKWLCFGLCKPPNLIDKCFTDNINKSPSKLCSQFDNVMLHGDFNLTTENKNLDTFMSLWKSQCQVQFDELRLDGNPFDTSITCV